MKGWLRVLAVGLIGCLLTGCTVSWLEFLGLRGRRTGASSSLVDFLYPNGEIPPDVDEKIPQLRLPLTVGLAFVPASGGNPVGLSEAHKEELLERVKNSFIDYSFVRDIIIIPETYMRSGGGFTNVEQVARLYGLDVIALVSYDQVSFVDENWRSITYWTIVGALTLEGSEHDVETFVDTAVFDVPTHRLLFRAPGTSKVTGASTLVRASEEFRKAQARGYDEAVEEMIANLDAELNKFRDRVKAQQANVKVSYRKGFAAYADPAVLVLLVALVAVVAARDMRRRGLRC
ncbi:MAG: rhombotarget lipoprotein [Candidatus Dadabacteria bacterium]|nr:MAG: rhombotarget lipoprotein [Candidatus Dadabacteria bacterium]